MRTNNATRRLAAALGLPLLLVVFGCDSVEPPRADPAGDLTENFQIDCSRSQTSGTMVFSASGAIADEGTVDGELAPWATNGLGPARWSGIRTFHGMYGDIQVFVVAENSQPDAAIARGDFQILQGTAKYTDLVGEGEFEIALNGDGQMGEYFAGALASDR